MDAVFISGETEDVAIPVALSICVVPFAEGSNSGADSTRILLIQKYQIWFSRNLPKPETGIFSRHVDAN